VVAALGEDRERGAFDDLASLGGAHPAARDACALLLPMR
jgi:hypothetical protein